MNYSFKKIQEKQRNLVPNSKIISSILCSNDCASIKVFSGYSSTLMVTSSTLMATYYTLTDLTDCSLVKISVKITKFRSRGRQKSSFEIKNLPKCLFIY